MTAKVHKIKHDMTLISFNKESVDKFQRWNSMLSLECDQNAYQLRLLDKEKRFADAGIDVKVVKVESERKVCLCCVIMHSSRCATPSRSCRRASVWRRATGCGRAPRSPKQSSRRSKTSPQIFESYSTLLPAFSFARMFMLIHCAAQKARNIQLPKLTTQNDWNMQSTSNGVDTDTAASSKKYLRKIEDIAKSLQACVAKDNSLRCIPNYKVI